MLEMKKTQYLKLKEVIKMMISYSSLAFLLFPSLENFFFSLTQNKFSTFGSSSIADHGLWLDIKADQIR